MENIYSEVDLTDPGMSWGEWKFSLPEDVITHRLSSLHPKRDLVNSNEENWMNLFSLIKIPYNESINHSGVEIGDSKSQIEDVPIESANSLNADENEMTEGHADDNVEDISSYVVDACNSLVPKLRLDISAVQVESKLVVANLVNLNQEILKKVMDNAWSVLQTDESRLCFCIVFASTSTLCCCLSRNILLPWLLENNPHKLELLSSILCKEGDTVCANLIAPLLQTDDSSWVRNLPDLEELMSAMTKKHWTILLKELLSDSKELQEWQIPVLTVAVQKAEPSYQELHLLVQQMSSVSTMFNENRDFGALVAAVASSLQPETVSLVPQLKVIVNNFKGSLKVMKFKTLKVIADISD